MARISSSIDHHVDGVQKALDAIERSLCTPLEIRSLAQLSGMSFWHFQRTFTQLLGESVASYIRRRRLTEISRALRRTRRPMLEIALEYQFQSHASFTRAFSATFGLSPSIYRRQPRPLRASRARVTRTQLRHFLRISAEPQMVDCAELHLVGLTAVYRGVTSENPNDNDVVPKLWDRFFTRQHEIKASYPGARYGAWIPAPNRRGDCPDQYVALASVEIPPNGAVPAKMEKWVARAGRYARFIHRGPARLIGETISYIYTSWLPRAKHRRGSGFDYLKLDSRFAGENDHSEIEYYLPIHE